MPWYDILIMVLSALATIIGIVLAIFRPSAPDA